MITRLTFVLELIVKISQNGTICHLSASTTQRDRLARAGWIDYTARQCVSKLIGRVWFSPMDAFYDRIARYYDPENDDVLDDLPLYSELADAANGTILDVGCGTGRVTFHLATEGHTVHGIDRSPEMLARAQRKQAQRSDLRERVILAEADVLTDPFPGTDYELILLPYNTFMHLHAGDEQQTALDRLAKVLAASGQIVLDIPNAGEAFAADHDGALAFGAHVR